MHIIGEVTGAVGRGCNRRDGACVTIAKQPAGARRLRVMDRPVPDYLHVVACVLTASRRGLLTALALGATCLAGGCPALRAESPLVSFWVARFQVAHEARFRPYDGPAAWSARCDGLHGRC